MTADLPMEADYLADLRHYHGRSIARDVIRWNGQLWYAKVPHGEPWREMLAYRLGSRWLNIADVAYPDEAQGAEWADGRPFSETSATSYVLVRIAQDYAAAELPINDHDDALAGELVFSLWIRRRDSHPFNRAYVGGLPVFFDHHIAFGAETQNIPLQSFFRFGEDGGHAGRWRVRLLGGATPTTASERAASGGVWAIHRVHDRAAFDHHLDASVSRIQAMSADDIRDKVDLAGVPDPGRLTRLLLTTQAELGTAVVQLREVLQREE